MKLSSRRWYKIVATLCSIRSTYRVDIKMVKRVRNDAPRADVERLAPAFCFRGRDADVMAACAGVWIEVELMDRRMVEVTFFTKM